MTHSLHRQGHVESLKEDFVVLAYGGAQSVLATQKERLSKKFPRFHKMLKGMFSKRGIIKILRIVRKRESKEEFKTAVVLNSKEELYSYLKRQKDANTGKSVVVSGLFDEVNSCLKELDLCFHTVQFSLGYFGSTELLPREEILEMTTMCGHHMVSTRLVEKVASDVGKGKITPKEAVQAMGKLCACEIFNEARAAKIIEALIK